MHIMHTIPYHAIPLSSEELQFIESMALLEACLENHALCDPHCLPDSLNPNEDLPLL